MGFGIMAELEQRSIYKLSDNEKLDMDTTETFLSSPPFAVYSARQSSIQARFERVYV